MRPRKTVEFINSREAPLPEQPDRFLQLVQPSFQVSFYRRELLAQLLLHPLLEVVRGRQKQPQAVPHWVARCTGCAGPKNNHVLGG